MKNQAADLHREIMLACGRGDVRLFRNNTGLGWTGDAQRLPGGAVLIRSARPLHAGLCVGSSDLVGWRTVQVTPDMVGRPVALFVAIEAKGGTSRPSVEQRTFIQVVRDMGGLAGLARSIAEAEKILKGE